jgi:hypothetical protein
VAGVKDVEPVEDLKDPNNIDEETRERQIEKENDLIWKITDKVNTDNLDPMALLLIDDLLS